MTSRERRCTVNYIPRTRRVQSIRRRLSNLSQPLALHNKEGRLASATARLTKSAVLTCKATTMRHS